MNTEIERKWLVDRDSIPYELEALRGERLCQAYISFSPTIRIRSINGESFVLTVKGRPANSSGIERTEYELNISKGEFEALLKKTEGRVIEKTRYKFPDGKYTRELDVFHGELEGLCYLEVEFPSVAEAEGYIAPNWVKRDVTAEGEYTNGSLARNGMPKNI